MVDFYRFFLVLFVAVSLYSHSYAQGQLFTKEEANERFGPVLQQYTMQMDTFNEFLDKSSDKLMFKIADNQVFILDGNRNVLYPEGIQISKEEIFTVYGINVINELFSKGGSNEIQIEQRRDVLSITVGEVTMEVGALCPPFCS
jgi:hypothetical protein